MLDPKLHETPFDNAGTYKLKQIKLLQKTYTRFKIKENFFKFKFF